MPQFTRRSPGGEAAPRKGWLRMPISWRMLRAGREKWHLRRNEQCTFCGLTIPPKGVMERDELEAQHRPCGQCVKGQARHERRQQQRAASEQARAARPTRQEYQHNWYQQRRARLQEVRARRRQEQGTQDGDGTGPIAS